MRLPTRVRRTVADFSEVGGAKFAARTRSHATRAVTPISEKSATLEPHLSLPGRTRQSPAWVHFPRRIAWSDSSIRWSRFESSVIVPFHIVGVTVEQASNLPSHRSDSTGWKPIPRHATSMTPAKAPNDAED